MLCQAAGCASTPAANFPLLAFVPQLAPSATDAVHQDKPAQFLLLISLPRAVADFPAIGYSRVIERIISAVFLGRSIGLLMAKSSGTSLSNSGLMGLFPTIVVERNINSLKFGLDSTRFHRDVPTIGAAPDDWVAARAEFLPNGRSDSSILVGQVLNPPGKFQHTDATVRLLYGW